MSSKLYILFIKKVNFQMILLYLKLNPSVSSSKNIKSMNQNLQFMIQIRAIVIQICSDRITQVSFNIQTYKLHWTKQNTCSFPSNNHLLKCTKHLCFVITLFAPFEPEFRNSDLQEFYGKEMKFSISLQK